nr:polysaccharide pyruvyl transferase family protein [Ensifer adhaerens]
MNSDAPALWPQRLKFDAVRGKLSQAKVAPDDDIALGDPAILLPLMWPKMQARHRVTVIPHFATHQAFVDEFANCLPRHWSILNLLGDPETIANEISASDLVVSSSLHGLIVADAYGVPSCWMEPHGDIKGDGFKFADYSSFRGRDLVGPIDFRDFVASPEAVLQEADHVPAVPSTETLDKLLKAFPFA